MADLLIIDTDSIEQISECVLFQNTILWYFMQFFTHMFFTHKAIFATLNIFSVDEEYAKRPILVLMHCRRSRNSILTISRNVFNKLNFYLHRFILKFLRQRRHLVTNVNYFMQSLIGYQVGIKRYIVPGFFS